jgi:hypothetical protein
MSAAFGAGRADYTPYDVAAPPPIPSLASGGGWGCRAGAGEAVNGRCVR